MVPELATALAPLVAPDAAADLTAADVYGHRAVTEDIDTVEFADLSESTDVLLVPEPHWIFGVEGTTHGSPYDYDTHVPIIFMGPGIKRGKYNGAVALNDIAPTLATMLEIEIPSGSSGRVLDEMLAAR